MENLPIITTPKPAGSAGKSLPGPSGTSTPDAEGSEEFGSVLQRQLSEQPDAAPAPQENAAGHGEKREDPDYPALASPPAADSLMTALMAAPHIKSLQPAESQTLTALPPGIDTSTATSILTGASTLSRTGPLPETGIQTAVLAGAEAMSRTGSMPEAGRQADDLAESLAASGKTLPIMQPRHEDAVVAAADSGLSESTLDSAASLIAQRPGAADAAALPGRADNPLHAHALTTAASRHSHNTVPELKLAPAVGATGWDSALAQKVVWQVGQNLQVAELHLNPPQLGPLQIQVSMAEDQGVNIATAHFVSQHAAVREAVEAALPRLREMLAESGISLGNTTVGNGAFRQPGFAHADAHPNLPRAANEPVAPAVAAGNLRVMHAVRNGMVDTFA